MQNFESNEVRGMESLKIVLTAHILLEKFGLMGK